MTVQRLSIKALNSLLDGKTREAATCLIKFYSNDCHYCHALKDFYEEISSDYEGVYFFAFNIDDHPEVERQLKFNGVPTIAMVIAEPPRTQVKILSDPEKPHKDTWYRRSDIKNFIESYS